MKIIVILAVIAYVFAADAKREEDAAVSAQNKDKRETQEGAHTSFTYRVPRKQEPVAPVEELQDDDKVPVSRADAAEYRPGQVFSLNAQELLDLQPERRAPLPSGPQLQQLYSEQQPEHKQNLQQIYYLEPQARRQVTLQPSHAVIARPHYSSNGGEASVGAALSVSDTGASSSDSFDQELLALLSHTAVRQEEPRQQAYAQAPQPQSISTQNAPAQYQQVDRYITKPSKKPTKLRSKVQITPPQSPIAPQQYLIETTNIQQQQQQQQQQVPQQHYQQQNQQQYRSAPQPHSLSQPQPVPQRPAQALRYVSIQPSNSGNQQVYYDQQEPQGIKIVPAPKLQQPRAQLNYRLVNQYQQPEATPKQYRLVEAPRMQPVRQEQQRLSSSNIERPVAYLKRFPESEKMRSVKIYDQGVPEGLSLQQPAQIIGEQYYLRPVYRSNEQRPRYDLPAHAAAPIEQPRVVQIEATKPPLSAIYVSKNIAPPKALKKSTRPQPMREQQPTRLEQVNVEQHGQNLDDQRSHLPPPRNNKAYTPEEFAALVAAGYSVTPIPVNPSGSQIAQSRSSVEAVPAQSHRRPLYRRHQYLPLRADDSP